MMPRYGMDTGGTCHEYCGDTNFSHKESEYQMPCNTFEVSNAMHRREGVTDEVSSYQ